METIRAEQLTFTYPLAESPALRNISFRVKESRFVVLCGKSGCGKSTLLKQMKKNLVPYGETSGKVLYRGEPVTELDNRRSAAEIGFVRQDPDNQIVTDKVWHELAFGLESLGFSHGEIRRRTAEMASYFNIQGWFRKNITELSGGQKQLLNLASIMAMQPKLLILDEPTSQLDPIAASEFLQTVYKINRELGTTVIISEHRLEELFPMADEVMVMDGGEIIAYDRPAKIGAFLSRGYSPGLDMREPPTGSDAAPGPDVRKTPAGSGIAPGLKIQEIQEAPGKPDVPGKAADTDKPVKAYKSAEPGKADGAAGTVRQKETAKSGSAAAVAETDASSGKSGREGQHHPMFYGLPSVMRIFSEVCPMEDSPLTIRDGRLKLEELLRGREEKTGAADCTADCGCESDGVSGEKRGGIREKISRLLKPAGSREPGGGQKPEKTAKPVKPGEIPGNGAAETSYRAEETGSTAGAPGAQAVRKTPKTPELPNEDASSREGKDDIETVIELKDVWFRYTRDGGDILRGLDLTVKAGQLFCLLGGNGTGKSTALKVIAGALKPQRGKIKTDLKVLSMLPQNPQAIFTEITCEEELLEALYYRKISDREKISRTEKMLILMEIGHLRKANPYDLSGGEQQRLALGKILLLEPEILLLDEPTKGLDPFFKRTLAGILRRLTNNGVTIFMVSHDIEFCAQYGDRCALFFDGGIVSEGEPGQFFSGNSFYTTAANKVAREWQPAAITCEEVAEWLKTVI